MDFSTFENELILMLKNKDEKCLKFIDSNRDLIEKNLGSDANPKTIGNFIEKIGNVIINTKNKLIQLKSNYDLIGKVLNHPYLSNVKEAFIKSRVLIEACKVGNKDAVKWLLSNMNVSPYVQDDDGMTCLMYAAKNNYQFVIKPHLKDIHCLELADKCGNNVLFYSVVNPDFIEKEEVSNNIYPRKLINSGIDINHTNNNGETALLYCIKNNNFRPIQYLLKHIGIDVNVADNDGKTAAMYLLEKGEYYEFLSLHKKNCLYDYVNMYNNQYQSVLSIILKKMYGGEKVRESVPLKSFIRIFIVLVSYQIDFNIPVDDDENTTFMVVLGCKDLETATVCAKYLKKLDLSIKNKYGENSTSLCMKLGYENILELIKENPTFNYHYKDYLNQNNLLMYSVINNCILMNDLLERDPDIINEVNNKNENALIIACKINQMKAAETLLKRGININQQDHLGNTALHYAVNIEKPKLIQLLMSKNPDLELRNKNGKTVKDLAIDLGNKKILGILNNPFAVDPSVYKDYDNTNNKNLEKYIEEVKEYLTPLFNNDYPDYEVTKEIEKTQKSIYSRYTITENFYITKENIETLNKIIKS